MRILVVEDHERVAALMHRLLARSGFVVDAVASVGEAEAAMAVARYDALVLDLSLPDEDGAALLRRLRRAGHGVPVVVATARENLQDRINLLNEGADDYLVKPFSLDELLARLRAVLRRTPEPRSKTLKFGNIVFETEGQRVRIGDANVDMTRRELAVLGTLLRNQGRVLSREALEQSVYTLDDEVSPNAIEAVVSRLRRRLEERGASASIVVMRGLGYMLSDRGGC